MNDLNSVLLEGKITRKYMWGERYIMDIVSRKITPYDEIKAVDSVFPVEISKSVWHLIRIDRGVRIVGSLANESGFQESLIVNTHVEFKPEKV